MVKIFTYAYLRSGPSDSDCGKPECELVAEVIETGWTYVPQEEEKRALAVAGDLKEFTSYKYDRILTNNTQDCAAFAKQVSAENHDDLKTFYWTYNGVEGECAVAANKDYRQQSESRTVSGSTNICFTLGCPEMTMSTKGIKRNPTIHQKGFRISIAQNHASKTKICTFDFQVSMFQ